MAVSSMVLTNSASGLAPNGFAHATELFGVRIPPRLVRELFAFFDEGLLQGNACIFGGLDQLVACDLKQA